MADSIANLFSIVLLDSSIEKIYRNHMELSIELS